VSPRISPPANPGPTARLGFEYSKRQYGKVPEPAVVMAHHPRLLKGYGAFELALEHSHEVDDVTKYLAMTKAALVAGCEFCIDIGAHLGRVKGMTEQQLRDLVGDQWRESDAYSPLERLAIEYAVAMTHTPIEASDELFERLREHLSEAQLVELTTAVALENYRARFNYALGIESQGFSEGAWCPRPDTAPAASS
jgi:AhpD family alkylhydroperoxidase